MPDTVVIGGGAAGIAAARHLHDAGVDVLLIEAADRLGGRAHTVTLPLPCGGAAPVDFGCSWLHSARRNPWVSIAENHGVAVVRSPNRWGDQWRDLGFPPDARAAFGRAWTRWNDAAHAALGGPDRPLSDFVAADDPWRAHLDAISGFANGAPLDRTSLHDWAAYEDAAGDDNWTLPDGYGALVVGQAADIPVRAGVRVTRIDRRGATLRVETEAGTIETRRVIVAAPTTAIADGTLAILPALPAKRAAAAALPLGLADKVFLHVADPPWPADAHLIGDPHSACTASYRLSPFGRPVIEAFLGGACAEALERGDAAAFAIDELVRLVGSGMRARLTPLAVTRWRAETGIGGSYSHARIGEAGQRRVLAEPVEDRIFFAGEACHPHDFSTAHGAYATGIAAAQAVLRARGAT